METIITFLLIDVLLSVMVQVLLSQSMTELKMAAAGGCTWWFELHNTARVNQQAPACHERWMVGGLETRFSIEFQFPS